MKRIVSIIAGLALLGVLMAWQAGLFGVRIAPQMTPPAAGTPAVGATTTVEVAEEPTFEYATGTVEARDEALVSSRIMAAIRQVHVRAGDSVTAGQVLVELDAREETSRVAQVGQDIAGAEARVTEARSHHERTARLAAQGAASRQELERALAALRAAEAALAGARGRLAETTSARSHATLTAPFAGRVVERYAEPGDTAVPGRPLLKLYAPDRLRLVAQVRESLGAALVVGAALTVHVDAVDRDFAATVEEIVPSADPGSRSVTVRLALPSEAGLYPGLFGRLAVPTGTARRLRVPANAVRRFGQLEFVEVVGEDGTSRRYVRTGRVAGDGRVDVLSGLDGGERVLLGSAAR
ncbi:MAG: efflux RND transporter periplasmic adaptor subunit [Gammaproteobacteria bacterium]